jgi:hypothetical protein
MFVRTPLVKTKQDGSIRIQDLTKVIMARRRRRLSKQRLVPLETFWHILYSDDGPCAFHRISAVGLASAIIRVRLRASSAWLCQAFEYCLCTQLFRHRILRTIAGDAEGKTHHLVSHTVEPT